jgi:hypothetical protein
VADCAFSEALALTESDVDARRGSVLVRHGKGDKRREAWTTGASSTSALASSDASSCPSGRCSA